MSFNLGELKVEIKVSQGGELKIEVKVLNDYLNQKFPIDNNKKLFLSDEEFDKYVNEILSRKERWIRDNIPAGVYSLVIKLDDENLIWEGTK